MKFNVGDRVVVKHVRVGDDTGNIFFHEKMVEYIGQEGTIEDTYVFDDGSVTYFIEGFGFWKWDETWLEHAGDYRRQAEEESRQISDFINEF